MLFGLVELWIALWIGSFLGEFVGCQNLEISLDHSADVIQAGGKNLSGNEVPNAAHAGFNESVSLDWLSADRKSENDNAVTGNNQTEIDKGIWKATGSQAEEILPLQPSKGFSFEVKETEDIKESFKTEDHASDSDKKEVIEDLDTFMVLDEKLLDSIETASTTEENGILEDIQKILSEEDVVTGKTDLKQIDFENLFGGGTQTTIGTTIEDKFEDTTDLLVETSTISEQKELEQKENEENASKENDKTTKFDFKESNKKILFIQKNEEDTTTEQAVTENGLNLEEIGKIRSDTVNFSEDNVKIVLPYDVKDVFGNTSEENKSVDIVYAINSVENKTGSGEDMKKEEISKAENSEDNILTNAVTSTIDLEISTKPNLINEEITEKLKNQNEDYKPSTYQDFVETTTIITTVALNNLNYDTTLAPVQQEVEETKITDQNVITTISPNTFQNKSEIQTKTDSISENNQSTLIEELTTQDLGTTTEKIHDVTHIESKEETETYETTTNLPVSTILNMREDKALNISQELSVSPSIQEVLKEDLLPSTTTTINTVITTTEQVNKVEVFTPSPNIPKVYHEEDPIVISKSYATVEKATTSEPEQVRLQNPSTSSTFFVEESKMEEEVSSQSNIEFLEGHKVTVVENLNELNKGLHGESVYEPSATPQPHQDLEAEESFHNYNYEENFILSDLEFTSAESEAPKAPNEYIQKIPKKTGKTKKKDKVELEEPLEEEILENFEPIIKGQFLGQEVQLSVKVVKKDSSFYVPPDALFLEQQELINITWRSLNEDFNNSLTITLSSPTGESQIGSIQLNLFEGNEMVQRKKNVSIATGADKSGQKVIIELDKEMHLQFSSLGFLKTPREVFTEVENSKEVEFIRISVVSAIISLTVTMIVTATVYLYLRRRREKVQKEEENRDTYTPKYCI